MDSKELLDIIDRLARVESSIDRINSEQGSQRDMIVKLDKAVSISNEKLEFIGESLKELKTQYSKLTDLETGLPIRLTQLRADIQEVKKTSLTPKKFWQGLLAMLTLLSIILAICSHLGWI